MMLLWLSLPGLTGSGHVNDPSGFKFSGPDATLGTVITSALDYVFVIAGLILLFIILGSGFQLMTSAGNEETMANAKKSLTNGAIGFGVVFLSFWIYQIVKAMLGI